MGSHLQGFQEEPQQDEILSALGYFLSSSSGQFSSSEYKTEPEGEHKVLHRQQRHRLNSLGSCPGCRHSVLCQPGVQPVQGWWQPRRHQGRQQQGNKHQVLPWQQQSHWQRPCWLSWRLRNCCRHSQPSWQSMWLKNCPLSCLQLKAAFLNQHNALSSPESPNQ